MKDKNHLCEMEKKEKEVYFPKRKAKKKKKVDYLTMK